MYILKEGVFGSKLVQYFEEELQEEPPVAAVFIEQVSSVEIIYRMRFADGSVSDYKVTFEEPFSLEITDVELFDRVI